MVQIEQRNITEFLALLVELGGFFSVDESLYVHQGEEDGEKVYLEVGETKRPLMIYTDKISSSDPIVLNPFSELLADSPDRKWFYVTRPVVLTGMIRETMRAVIEAAITIKDKKKSDEVPIDLVPYVSKVVDVVDAKLVEELNTITKNFKDFLNIVWRKKTKEAALVCGLYDDDNFMVQFPKIRKKSWDAFRLVLETVLGKKPTEIRATSKLMSCPRFEAFTKVLGEALEAVDRFKQLTGIELCMPQYWEHWKNIPLYHEKARWLSQSTAVMPAKEKEEAPKPWSSSLLQQSPLLTGVQQPGLLSQPAPMSMGFGQAPTTSLLQQPGMVMGGTPLLNTGMCTAPVQQPNMIMGGSGLGIIQPQQSPFVQPEPTRIDEVSAKSVF